MRGKIRQSTTFRYVQHYTSQLCCKGIKPRPDVFLDMNITFKYFLCVKKKTVNSNVLSLNLKLFQTKVDIKSVTREYLLRNYVVNV